MLPVILLPLGTDDEALDACLAALDAGCPAGTRVWLADNAHAGPRGLELIQRWLEKTRLQAAFSRRSQRIGEAAHLAEMLTACGNEDVIVLAADTIPTAGWVQQLVACLQADAAIGSATTWCNAGETASWPHCAQTNPIPAHLPELAQAASRLPAVYPELPNAVAHAVMLRGRARAMVGALDGASYRSWYAALVDYSLRLSGLGWRNALCVTAFVARHREAGPSEGDNAVLRGRWPGWYQRLTEFVMQDALYPLRQNLQQHYQQALRDRNQGDLFPSATPAPTAPASE